MRDHQYCSISKQESDFSSWRNFHPEAHNKENIQLAATSGCVEKKKTLADVRGQRSGFADHTVSLWSVSVDLEQPRGSWYTHDHYNNLPVLASHPTEWLFRKQPLAEGWLRRKECHSRSVYELSWNYYTQGRNLSTLRLIAAEMKGNKEGAGRRLAEKRKTTYPHESVSAARMFTTN